MYCMCLCMCVPLCVCVCVCCERINGQSLILAGTGTSQPEPPLFTPLVPQKAEREHVRHHILFQVYSERHFHHVFSKSCVPKCNCSETFWFGWILTSFPEPELPPAQLQQFSSRGEVAHVSRVNLPHLPWTSDLSGNTTNQGSKKQ